MKNQFSGKSIFRIIALSGVAVFFSAAASAQENNATVYADAQTGLLDIAAPLIDASDGYSWLPNRNYEPGKGGVVYWARKHYWGPGKTVAIGDVYGVYEDGTCQHHSHLVYSWEPSTGYVYRDGYTRGDIRFTAIFERTSDVIVDAYLTGHVGDRDSIEILDRVDSTDEGINYTQTFFREGEDWVPYREERNAWRLEKPDNSCGL